MARSKDTTPTKGQEPKSIQSSDSVPALSSMLTFIERAARDPSFDVNKFSILLDRQEALLKQHQMAMYDSSYTDMQNELNDIKRSGKNPTFSNPYAKLEDLDAAARPIWTKYGFAVRFGTKPNPRDGWMTGTVIVSHRGGHREEIELPAPIDFQNSGYRSRTPVQAVGSTTTYLRRYLLMMALNLVPKNDPTDDDGEGQRARRDPPHDEERYYRKGQEVGGIKRVEFGVDPNTGEDLEPEDAEEDNFVSTEEIQFHEVALEAARHGHEQLANLYRNASKRNKQRITDWKAELEAAYPKDTEDSQEADGS